MPDEDKIVAIGLLTARDMQTLGSTFHRAFPVESNPTFSGLLKALEEAETKQLRPEKAESLGAVEKPPDLDRVQPG